MSIRPSYIAHWYAVSKAALEHYTRNAAALYAPAGIRVNGIRAGCVNTQIYAKHGMLKLTTSFIDQCNAASLQGRMAEPYEIAEVIAFLANNKKARLAF